VLPPAAVPCASNEGITLYGYIRPPQLYLASNAAAAEGTVQLNVPNGIGYHANPAATAETVEPAAGCTPATSG